MTKEEGIEKGIITTPPDYSDGVYCNKYIKLEQNEMTIYKNKIERVDPKINDTLKSMRVLMFKDKKFTKQLLKKVKKKKQDDVTNLEFLQNFFTDVSKTQDEIIDLNYFSQYIQEIGFKVGIEMMFNCVPGQIYIALISLNPPGSMYRFKEKSFEKVIVLNEIDYKSHQGKLYL